MATGPRMPKRTRIEIVTSAPWRLRSKSIGSNPSQLPIVLVALDQHHAHYHRISKDKQLLDQGVSKDPTSMSIDEIRAATWEVMRGYFDRRLSSDIQRLAEAEAQNKGSTVVSDLVREASNGRVELLILEEDAQLPGAVDWVTGAIADADSAGPNSDDVMDDLAEMVLSRGGNVRIVHPGSLANATKAGGIFRY